MIKEINIKAITKWISKTKNNLYIMEDARSLQKFKKSPNITLLPEYTDKLAATMLIKAREEVTSSAIQ